MGGKHMAIAKHGCSTLAIVWQIALFITKNGNGNGKFGFTGVDALSFFSWRTSY